MNTTTPNTAPITMLAVSQIDEKSKEVIESAGGKVCQVETDVIPSLFIIALPDIAIIATGRHRYCEIAVLVDGLDHIMQLELTPDVTQSSLRYLANYEAYDLSAALLSSVAASYADIEDLGDLDDGPR